MYLLTRSELALGVIGACRCVPVLVLGLWGGLAADRLDRRRVMLATQMFMAVVSTSLFLLTRANLITPPIIYAAVALIAATAAFENPARNSFVVNVLPEEDLENGLALNVLGWQTASVVGPAIGGVLLAATSIPVLYAVDAISFLPLIGVLFLIRARSPDPAAKAAGAKGGAAPKTGLAAIADALVYLRNKPVLIQIMWIDFVATLFAGSLLLLPVFSKEVFHRGAEGLGWLMSAPAVGAVIAGAVLSSRPPIRRHGPVLLAAVAAYGLSTALFGLTPSFWIGLALLAASGAADTVSTVVRQVARQTMIPDDMRGRLNAVHMLFFVSGPQLGELEAGALAEVTTVRFSVVSGGLGCLAMAAAVWALSPRMRALRVAPPGAEAAEAASA
jgi:MFS family permease